MLHSLPHLDKPPLLLERDSISNSIKRTLVHDTLVKNFAGLTLGQDCCKITGRRQDLTIELHCVERVVV